MSGLRFVVKRLLELVIVSSLIYVLVAQYIVPCLTNALLPWNQHNITMVTERVLKLAVPNLYVWLLGFYGVSRLKKFDFVGGKSLFLMEKYQFLDNNSSFSCIPRLLESRR